jgi:dihydrofolate reductase
MDNLSISIMTAASNNMIIGKNNSLPWKLKEDTEYYLNLVNNQICVYGRKTFDNDYKNGLTKNKICIVITNNNNKLNSDNVFYTNFNDVYDLLILTQNKYPEKKIFILGGYNIYAFFLPKCKYIYFTLINKYYDGDTIFPYYTGYEILSFSKIYYSEECQCEYQFQIYKNTFKNTNVVSNNLDNIKLYY